MRVKRMWMLIIGFLFVGVIYASSIYGVPSGYISPYNGYCDEWHTKNEMISVWWSPVGTQSSLADWLYTKIPNFQNVAHRVNHITLSYPTAPFVYSDNNPPWTNGAPWSDTWGVCAYFDLAMFTDNSTIGPDPVLTFNDTPAKSLVYKIRKFSKEEMFFLEKTDWVVYT